MCLLSNSCNSRERVRVLGGTTLSWNRGSGDVLLPGLQVTLVTFSSLISHLARCSVFWCIVNVCPRSSIGEQCHHNKEMRTRSAGASQFRTICHHFQSGNSWGKNLQAARLLWEGIPIRTICPLFFLLPVLSPCQELDLGLHRLLVWPSVAVLMFLCSVILTPSVFEMCWRGGGTLKPSHSSQVTEGDPGESQGFNK